MVGVDSFTREKVVGLATFHRNSVWQSTLSSRSLHGRGPAAAKSHLRPRVEQLLPYIYSVSRLEMDASADAGRELLSCTYSQSLYPP